MSLCVNDLSFSYGQRQVLRDVSFQAHRGEVLSVLGPNGAGKSTLFRCMLGLLTPTAGGTQIDGRDVSRMGASELSRAIAYIPQSHNPVFNFAVLDMVLMGTTAQIGRFSAPGAAQLAQAEAALAQLGIAHLRDRGYCHISGGERQLVLIARAIAQQAKILVMDEPSASLDFGNRLRVMETIGDLARKGYAIIQSTHDPEQAYQYSHRILALYQGRVVAFGTPQETMQDGLISQLYGVPVAGFSFMEDKARVFLPVKESNEKERME